MNAAQQDLVTVSKERFCEIMGSRNVHPRPERDRSVWIDLHSHAVVGISTPGYMCEGETTYAIRSDIHRAAA